LDESLGGMAECPLIELGIHKEPDLNQPIQLRFDSRSVTA
jgi:hypothetical protein